MLYRAGGACGLNQNFKGYLRIQYIYIYIYIWKSGKNNN